jgi:UDP-GlcNAc:undecaprenyl-phosphate/decaprenyl-phosphate GlcNAc-1-phosphate transferase
VRALPFVLALIVAVAVTPAALRHLAENGLVRENYRDRQLPFPAGFAIVAAVAVALVPLGALRELSNAKVFYPEISAIAIYTLGVAFLGFADDMLSGPSRGWRGHAAAALDGAFSTGALKAVGALGFAMFALSGRGLSDGRYVLEVVLLVLTTNLFNLLDLRPGRSVKALVILGAGLTLGATNTRPLGALGLFLAPALVVGIYDLREQAMLGDTGSNLVGALAGLWMVLTLGAAGQVAALVIVLAATVYGEFRSISTAIERTPVLRELDSLGRPA